MAYIFFCLSKLFDLNENKQKATEPAISIMVYLKKMKGTLMDKKRKKKTPILPSKWEFASNVSQDSSLQKSVISTFSQCSQQKFLIHNAWIPSKKKKKKITKTQTFLNSKITKFL